jgi:hypothetical protein
MALEMRPGCERCGRDLPGECKEAYICSFECTFCLECAGSGTAGFGAHAPSASTMDHEAKRVPGTMRPC